MPQATWVPTPGYIIRADVPRTDSSTIMDTRFPVIVSGAKYNRQYPDVIVAYTTRSSNIRHPRAYDVEISDKHSDFGSTGLSQSTTVRCGRLHTVAQRRILEVIGVVPDDLLGDIIRLVLQCFDKDGGLD